MAISLRNLETKVITPSTKADEYTDRLKRQLGLSSKGQCACLAIGRSLREQSQPSEPPDTNGTGIRVQSIFGADVSSWVGVITEAIGCDAPDDKIISDQIRRHWDRGAALLYQEWKDCEEQLPIFIERLCSLALLPQDGPDGEDTKPGGVGSQSAAIFEGYTGPLELTLGTSSTSVDSGEKISWVLNADGQSPHFAVFGKPGKGKTRLTKEILHKVRSANVPVLVFDPKGDLRQSAAELNAKVIVLGQDPIPLHVLDPGNSGDSLQVVSGIEQAFAAIIHPNFGPKIRDRLRTIAKRVFQAHPKPTVDDLLQAISSDYQRNGIQADSLLAAVNKLKDFQLFDSTISPNQFFSQSWILSVNAADDELLRFCLVFVMDAMLRYIRVASDSKRDASTNTRALRLVLAIDEARRVLDVAPKSILEGLILEGRSKGFACGLISQSPDHISNVSEDVLKNLEVICCFESDVEMKTTKKLFRGLANPALIQNLSQWVCLARLPKKDPIQVKAWE